MGQMETKLVEVPHPTKPGREIQVHTFKVNNFRYHGFLTMISRMLLGVIESQTNNMVSESVPRETSALWKQWEAVKAAYGFAKKHNNPPSAAHEFNYVVSFPTGVELQKIPNVKSKMVALEVAHLAEVVMATDSANANANIGPGSMADIDTQLAIAEDAMLMWIGKGGVAADVDQIKEGGQAVPHFKWLGRLVPDIDQDYRGVQEPTADMPSSGRPDVADVPTSGD